MNLYLLFIPGGLFLMVIFFRVVLPLIKTPAWKRLLDSARYERVRENPEKSDRILEKALLKYPLNPQVYLEYFLSHSDGGNLKKRFEVLLEGVEKAPHTSLRFFLGNAYLEEGDFPKAREVLSRADCREYMRDKRICLWAELLYDSGDFSAAKKEFIDFYSALFPDDRTPDEVLQNLSARELLLYLLILSAAGEDYRTVMNLIPPRSVRTEMGWKDLYEFLQDEYRKLTPARTGIYGSPERFNRRRREYFLKRLHLIEEHLKSTGKGS